MNSTKKDKENVQNLKHSLVKMYLLSRFIFLLMLLLFILQEFVAGLSLILRGSMYDRLNWAFNFYDNDKDGFITKEVC